MICAGPAAGGTGVCLGDSGGPLFVETPDGSRLIGVASWTIAQNGRCLRPGAFSVFAQATADDDWLSRMLAEN
jgi:secreted trypsin-like serine protease